jgi:hypothetical protein
MTSSAEDIQHFLVVYDVARSVAAVEEFGTDYDSALEAYAEREREYRLDSAVEVVLLGADSLDTVKKTHSSYFLRPGEHAFASIIRSAARQN